MARRAVVERPPNPVGHFIAILIVVLVFAGLAAPAGAQEVVNGGFEHADAEGQPTAWMVQARGLHVEPVDSESDDAGTVLKVSGNGAQGSALIKQEIDLGNAGFSGATLRGRIRTRDVAPSATLVAILEGPDGRIFVDDMRDRVVAGDTEWRTYTIDIPASAEAQTLTVGALVIGSGTAWFDAIELAERQAQAPAGIDLREYVLEALSLLREHYLLPDRVDWDRVRERGLGALTDQASMAQGHAAVAMMIEALDESHASFVRPVRSDPTEAGSSQLEPLTVERIAPGIALVRVPRVPGSTPEAARQRFADDAHQALQSMASPAPCGWIVDLRDNTGGNMWPMLAAVGPIAGTGVVGQFVGPEGEEVTQWIYRNGSALATSGSESKERLKVSVDPFPPVDPDRPVAVLVSGNTSSSGEAIAIAFVGRENTRLFGTATGGLATANSGFPLADDAMIVLPVAYMADRDGRVHHPDVQPDEPVGEEAAVDAALGWLRGQPSCSG